MGYVTLYRKWRPQDFDQVFGQDHIVRTLKNALDQNRVAHAYLFTGPRGTGKTSVAKILAKALNCEKGPTTTPCNECSHCIEISNGTSLDTIEIDAASNRGIDEIRDLREKVKYMPSGSRTKIYIVDEVHMLTPEAFNALLKMLEEPPAHVVFVLATTEPHRVLPTIVSRCQRFDFHRIKTSDLIHRLNEIAAAESIDIEDETLALIAKHAQGAMRDAISTLDQLASFTSNKVAKDDVTSLLGLTESGLLFRMVELIADGDTGGIFEFVDEIMDGGVNLQQFARDLMESFRNMFVIRNTKNARDIVDLGNEDLNRLEEMAGRFRTTEMLESIDRLSGLINEMRFTQDPRLVLEIALVTLAKKRGQGKEDAIAPVLTKDPVKKPDEKLVVPKRTVVKGDPDQLDRTWKAVLKQVRENKISTYALILECKPIELCAGTLVLEFKTRSSFHKNEVEKEQNRELIEEVLKSVTGKDIRIKCVIAEQPNGEPPVEEPVKEASEKAEPAKEEPDDKQDMLELLKESFDAKVINEGERYEDQL